MYPMWLALFIFHAFDVVFLARFRKTFLLLFSRRSSRAFFCLLFASFIFLSFAFRMFFCFLLRTTDEELKIRKIMLWVQVLHSAGPQKLEKITMQMLETRSKREEMSKMVPAEMEPYGSTIASKMVRNRLQPK